MPEVGGEDTRWLPSPNFTPAARAAADIDAIVIHTTEGHYEERLPFVVNQRDAGLEALALFQSEASGVSAHFVVDYRGRVTQLVRGRDVAWGANYYNWRAIHVDCAGWADRPETWTPALLDGLATLLAQISARWDVPLERPEGDARRGPLRLYLPRAYPGFDGAGVVAHAQVQTAGSAAVERGGLGVRTDPGPSFPWDQVLAAARERRAQLTATPESSAAPPNPR